jgi:hypothetical protein
MKKIIYLVLTLCFTSLVQAANYSHCKVIVEGTINDRIVSKLVIFTALTTQVEVEGSTYVAEAKIIPNLSVMLIKTNEPKLKIEIEDTLTGFTVSSYDSLDYITSAYGQKGESIYVDAFCR